MKSQRGASFFFFFCFFSLLEFPATWVPNRGGGPLLFFSLVEFPSHLGPERHSNWLLGERARAQTQVVAPIAYARGCLQGAPRLPCAIQQNN
jgi:hypothetical protein